LTSIKASGGRAVELSAAILEAPMTPFLALVLAGYALFMLVLGWEWLRSFIESLPAKTAATTDPALKTRPTERS